MRGRLLHQRHHVAHAEDAAGDARRIELLQRVELLAGADQLDRLAGDRAHGQGRAAATVAVDAGEHDAGQADALIEGARQIDGVLAGEGVGDQQNLVRIGGALDLGRLAHHGVVERGAAGGVEQHHVVAAEAGSLERALGDLRRHLALDHRQRVDPGVAAEHGELLHRRRAAHVERGHQHFLPLAVGQPLGDFGGGGGFAGALQADHHEDDRRRGVKIDAGALRAQRLDQLVVHDLDHHLAGGDRLRHLDADGVLLHLLGEGARHVERDVGFQQRAPHFAQRRIDVGFLQRAAPGEAVENTAELFRQTVEHRNLSSSRCV